MGCYLDAPKDGDILEWLQANGRPAEVDRMQFQDLEFGRLTLDEAETWDAILVACVENPGFKAALILDGPGQATRIARPDDPRPVTVWVVPKDKASLLAGGIERLEGILKEGR